MFHIVSAWGWATNPAYDPDTANNGGGYWQFAGGLLADLNGRLVAVEIDDTSCGDFGSRCYVDISSDGVLGVDAHALVCDAREAASLCARQEVC